MRIEDRIEKLEKLVDKLSNQISATKEDKWVTPSELAKTMGCSVNNIYLKIRSGEIYATDKLGTIKRIPMNQFYKDERVSRVFKSNEDKSIKEKVFGL